ncbi:hypothetical protein ACP70R_037778 [Stipagrostis hirtigluma subsp. patula]
MAGVQPTSSAASQIGGFLRNKPYAPLSWAAHLSPVPSHKFSLGHLPTPVHVWNLPNMPEGTEVWIKRDDLTGMELSGNKVRKLEFLMADAAAQGADSVVTVGGVQSSHCRATAVAARLLVDKDPGLVGNLLVERMVGAHIDLVSEEEYRRIGSVALADLLRKRLLEEGRKPYVIPADGSNSLGAWGYIEAVREIEQQIQQSPNVQFDDIVVACSSGGTIAGLALGSRLSSLKAKVHAFSIFDDPGYLYDLVQGLLDGLQPGLDSHDIFSIVDTKGLGYAMNIGDELKFVKDIASATGIILDPISSGKAAYGMLKDMGANPSKWKGQKILFVHTGGLLGLYDKVDQLSSLTGSWRKMVLEDSIPHKDGTGGYTSSA